MWDALDEQPELTLEQRAAAIIASFKKAIGTEMLKDGNIEIGIIGVPIAMDVFEEWLAGKLKEA